jgi:hypothetical protein
VMDGHRNLWTGGCITYFAPSYCGAMGLTDCGLGF